MKFVDEFRDSTVIRELVEKLQNFSFATPVNIMEVCGTHTVSIHRFGLHRVLPENVKHVSGPGCPVCVTPNEYLDMAIALARMEGFVITTFGDMMRVPGSRSSLEKENASGADIRVVYSPMDALKMAENEKDRTFVFLAVGFETTAPGIAATVKEAKKLGLKNFYILPGNKTMPQALKALIDDPEVKIDGFLLPGHVSTIVGSNEYRFIPEDYGIPCAVSGFEPADILMGFISILKQIVEGRPSVENTYLRSVRPEGNIVAKAIMKEVFVPCDSEWRGIGVIPDSGLDLAPDYMDFDIRRKVEIEIEEPVEYPGCRCGEVLKGLVLPPECPLFGKVCTPENPVGACMVSSEGSCSAYYKYG